MSEPDKSIDRRPLLRLLFEPRAPRSLKLWRKTFLYYVRHAERVANRPDLRAAVHAALAGAKAEIVACLGDRAVGAALSGYDNAPIAGCLEVEARFPQVVEYVELFRMADRVFVAVNTVEGAMGIRSRATQALRQPAQVVSETPGLERPPPA